MRQLRFPVSCWVPAQATGDLNCVIIGAGQAGLATGFALWRQGIDHFAIIDAKPREETGAWRQNALMNNLRTPKWLPGPELGVPSLSYECWHRTVYGDKSWHALERISLEDWVSYLDWYEFILPIPINRGVQATDLELHPDQITVTTVSGSTRSSWRCSTVVLATGMEGAGACRDLAGTLYRVPEECRSIATNLPLKPLFSLARKRVAIIGGGATAYDAALLIKEAGAKSVTILHRRKALPRFDAYAWASSPGLLASYSELEDHQKWKLMSRVLNAGQFPPEQSYNRAVSTGIIPIFGAEVKGADYLGEHVVLQTSRGPFSCDHVIVAAGFDVDLSRRRILSAIEPKIARWGDVFEPREHGLPDDATLASYPYLGRHFQFLEKFDGHRSPISRVFDFSFASTLSHGMSGASIEGLHHGIPRLVRGVSARLLKTGFGPLMESLRREVGW